MAIVVMRMITTILLNDKFEIEKGGRCWQVGCCLRTCDSGMGEVKCAGSSVV